MVGWILKKILGSKNQRELKRLAPIVRRINELDEQFKSLSDDDLRAKTAGLEGRALERFPRWTINGESWTKFCRKPSPW